MTKRNPAELLGTPCLRQPTKVCTRRCAFRADAEDRASRTGATVGTFQNLESLAEAGYSAPGDLLEAARRLGNRKADEFKQATGKDCDLAE